MSKLLEIYQNITEQLAVEYQVDWPKTLQQASLKVESQKVPLNQLHTQLIAFSPTQGWYQTLDTVQILALNSTLNLETSDPIICGEFINEQGCSLHIRPQGVHRLVTLYTPNTGESLLSAKYKHVLQSHGLPNGKVAIYKLYWDINETKQPKYSRFLKIQQEKKS